MRVRANGSIGGEHGRGGERSKEGAAQEYLSRPKSPGFTDEGGRFRLPTAAQTRCTISMMPRSDWYSDTDPQALEVFLECQRRMSASEKVQAIFSLTRMVFDTAQAEMRRRHPGIDEREAFLRTAALHLDRETMMRVYGWDPESAGA